MIQTAAAQTSTFCKTLHQSTLRVRAVNILTAKIFAGQSVRKSASFILILFLADTSDPSHLTRAALSSGLMSECL